MNLQLRRTDILFISFHYDLSTHVFLYLFIQCHTIHTDTDVRKNKILTGAAPVPGAAPAGAPNKVSLDLRLC